MQGTGTPGAGGYVIAMRAGPTFLVIASLVASWYLADEATYHWRMGGWIGVGWLAGVCGCAALIGATVGALGRWTDGH